MIERGSRTALSLNLHFALFILHVQRGDRLGIRDIELDWESRNSLKLQYLGIGGEGGIRTPVTVPRELDFESSAFNRARPPLRVLSVMFLPP